MVARTGLPSYTGCIREESYVPKLILAKTTRSYYKITKAKRTGGMAQMIKHLPRKQKP
jgi:hypothetical protein